MKTQLVHLHTLAACASLLAAPARVLSQPAANSAATAVPVRADTKDEARRRFDRGLTLYNAGDLDGALAEFRVTYKLTRHPVVLYNLALVYAALGKAADAVDAFEKLRAAGPAAIGAERAERARIVYEDQLERVGTLQIKADVPRASVQIDSVDVAKTPAPPLRVTAGTHLVSVSATAHEPRHLSVTIAGRAVEVLDVKLVPLADAVARLKPVTRVPDVEVRANGELIGRTPFTSELTLKPGVYELEFQRAGYVPVRRRVSLEPGSVSGLDVAMVPSDAGLAAGGVLSLSLSEERAVVTVDGQPRLDHTLGLRLPVGRHSIRIQRAGFFDVQRDVTIRPGPQSLDVSLLPTADHLNHYVDRANTQRTWSYLALGAGALITAGSGAFLLWNQAQKNDAEREFDAFANRVAAQPGGRCATDACQETLGILVDELASRRDRDVYGFVGVGVGAATLTVGALLYVLGADPGRYDPKPESDVFGTLRFGVRPAGFAISGVF